MTSTWLAHTWPRRALFLTANGVACIAVWIFVALPVSEFFDERAARIAMLHELLGRLEAVSSQEYYIQSAARETGVQFSRDEFLSGSSSGAISADLQSRLKALAESVGARVQSAQTLPPRTSDNIKFLGVRIDMHGTHQAVYRAAHAFENAKPYLFVSNAVLKPALSTAAKPGVAGEPTIQAQFDVFGAVQIEERN